ncbi:phage tail protein [Streptomyces sp. H27-H1]|uniref:phage tail protein n=1 Tax=Streptomyces sp. H27-H1 TaxID=2996461 RepID=UPI00226EC436|nr:phage tail protein [Streptomyces sp. H27-H1]MCY0931976.1 phage tail protein [Streptomyces sp. H27-H1]
MAAIGTAPSSKWSGDSMLGMAMRFKVTVDDFGDLGYWSSCRGLNVTFDHEEIECGGNYEHTVLLPKRLKYGTVTLQRAVKADDTKALQAWLRRVTKDWYGYEIGGTEYNGTGAEISLMNAHNELVYSWQLRSVFPKNWKGPDLDADTNKVALESLELAHQGFL